MDKYTQFAEKLIADDIGNRGISDLVIEGSLYSAVTSIGTAKRVLVTSGFFVPTAGYPETDGPLGCFALVQACLSVGSLVTLVTDERNAHLFKSCSEFRKIQKDIDFLVFPSDIPTFISSCPCPVVDDSDDASRVLAKDELASVFANICCVKNLNDLLSVVDIRSYDHMISIERVGGGIDGKCRNMRAQDITEFTGRIDALFLLAHLRKKFGFGGPTVVAIGDGGNEIGMGSVLSRIADCVHLGSQIACVVPSDYLITTGISNWGGYAISFCLHLLRQGQGWVPTTEGELELLDHCLEVGCVDGCTCKPTQSVDGVEFSVYVKKLTQMREELSNNKDLVAID